MAVGNSAFMDSPILREMLALEAHDEGLRGARAQRAARIVDAASRLAELQSLPEVARLRRAQAARAEYEVRAQAEADKLAAEAAGRHLTPQRVPVVGPTMPGEPPLGDVTQQPGPENFRAFTDELLRNPRTMQSAINLRKSMRGDFVPVPPGGLYDVGREQIIGGYSTDTLGKLYAARDAAVESGDLAKAEEYSQYITRLSRGSQGDRMKAINELLDIRKRDVAGQATEDDLVRASSLYGMLATPTERTDVAGNRISMPGMDLPPIAQWLESRGVRRAQPGAQPGPVAAPPGVTSTRPGAYGQEVAPRIAGGNLPLPEKAQESLSQRSRLTNILKSLREGFEDDFVMSKPLRGLNLAVPGSALEDLIFNLHRAGFAKTPGLANWWEPVYEMFSKRRNELFGATLTRREEESFNRLVAAMGHEPKYVRELLDQMITDSEAILRQDKEAALQQYRPEAVQSSIGEGRPNPYVFGRKASKEDTVQYKDESGVTRKTRRRFSKSGEPELYIDGKWIPAERTQ